MTVEGGPTAARTVRAVVRVGEVETSYLRIGRGAPVLLLVDTHGGESAPASAMPADPRWGLIIPDRTTIAALAAPVHGVGTPFARWLDGFLEGLGIAETMVVAPAYLAGELRAFAADWQGRLRGVLLRGPSQSRAFPRDVPVRYVASEAAWDEVQAVLPSLLS